MKVGICIVFYNDQKHLVRLSNALKTIDYTNFSVYFSDNHPEYIHEQEFVKSYPKGIYCKSEKNNGFAAGNNKLAHQAISDGCELVWILNPDMEPQADCLSKLVNCLAENNQTDAVGPVLLYGNSQGVIHFAGANVNFSSQKKTALFTDSSLKDLPKTNCKEVDLVNGGSLLIRSKKVKEIGLFAEEYFMYNDEIDLMRRIKNGGGQVRIVYAARCNHHHDWSKKNTEAYYLMYYYMMRNKVLYWIKFKHYRHLIWAIPSNIFKFPIIARFCKKTAGYKLIYFFYLGLLHGYLGKSGKSSKFG